MLVFLQQILSQRQTTTAAQDLPTTTLAEEIHILLVQEAGGVAMDLHKIAAFLLKCSAYVSSL
jgi:hypothetical protein